MGPPRREAIALLRTQGGIASMRVIALTSIFLLSGCMAVSTLPKRREWNFPEKPYEAPVAFSFEGATFENVEFEPGTKQYFTEELGSRMRERLAESRWKTEGHGPSKGPCRVVLSAKFNYSDIVTVPGIIGIVLPVTRDIEVLISGRVAPPGDEQGTLVTVDRHRGVFHVSDGIVLIWAALIPPLWPGNVEDRVIDELTDRVMEELHYRLINDPEKARACLPD